MSILDDAKQAVEGERQHSYGHPKDNHGCTAALWRDWLQRRFGIVLPLTARDVCWLNILQKASRDANRPKKDNLVDVIGYAENAERCELSTPRPDEPPRWGFKE